MMKTRSAVSVLPVVLCLATAALCREPSFEEHAAVQESLARVHPRMRASWLRERGVEDPYYTSVRADSGSGLRCIGRWSYGPSYDVDGRVTTSETLMALARGSGVSLLRFSRQDSLSIELLSDINAEGLMCRVKVVDTLLYVGSRKGLEIHNIADEQNPVRLSWTPIPLNDFALQDSLAYTISGDDSFRIYNISTPASPVFRGACMDSGDVVSVSGNAAFVGGRWGLHVLDVVDPTSPHRIGSWGSAIEQVQARGHLCYVTTFNPSAPGEITFHVLDVAVPSLPYQIGSLDSVGGNDVFLVDTLAFGAGENDFNRLTVISIADSTAPRLIGWDATRGWSMGIWASGLAQETFVGCHWEGLQIYDTRNTAQPVRDTFLLGCDQAVDICIDNDTAYVANEMAGLKILDISDPKRPKTLGSFDTTWQRPFMSSVVARDSFAFVDWYAVPVFRVIDVSIPSQPVMLGGVDVFNPPENMVIHDSLVYCAEMYRFQIVNVARPRQPVLVGSCAGDGVAVVVQDSFAYTAAGAIRITNIARPDSPFVVSTIARASRNLQLLDSILVCAPGPVMWFNVANPLAPVVVDSIDLGHSVYGLTAVDTIVYASTTGSALYAISIANLHEPRVLRQSTLPYNIAYRIVYAPPYLYLACEEAGVCIYETASVGITEGAHPKARTAGGLVLEPNPTSGRCALAGAVDLGGTVTVRDVVGRIAVASKFIPCHAGQLALDVARLKPGIYFVEVNTDRRISRVKLVKR